MSDSEVSEKGLGIGDKAPPLVVSQFIKGEAMTELAIGVVHVVEFWATWCGPCLQASPHLTALAKQYPQVHFLGVAVWESDPTEVAPFVEKRGDKMGYSVAIDLVPEGATGREGRMALTWLKAAGQMSIPTTFVIDANSRIAWIGHPMALDGPLEQIITGAWDTTAAAILHEKTSLWQRKQILLYQQFQEARQAKDYARLLSLADAAIAETQDSVGQFAMERLVALQGLSRVEEALDYGKGLIDGPLQDDIPALAGLAWQLANSSDSPTERLSPPIAALAVLAARRVDALTGGEDSHAANILAAALYASGDVLGAITAQERAILLAQAADARVQAADSEEGEENYDPGHTPRLRERLVIYQRS